MEGNYEGIHKMEFTLDNLEQKMKMTIDTLKSEFTGLRTGRASTAMVEPLKVLAYGSLTPLSQLATISIIDSRMLSVQIWDKELVNPVIKAIQESGLGLNPIVEGTSLRIPVPPLSEERRVELVKVCGKYAEQARIVVRNIRKEGMDTLKNLEKAKQIGQDEQHKQGAKLQDITDKYIKIVDTALSDKEKEVMAI